MNTISKIAVLILITCISCNSKKSVDENHITFSEFEEEVDLEFNDVFKFEKGAVNNLFLMDTTLLVRNSNSITDYLFYQYALGSNSLKGKYIKGGRKFGQTLGSLSTGVYKNKLWVNDITLEKILTTDVSKPNLADSNDKKEFPFPTFYYSNQFIDSLKLLTSGSLNDKSKLQVIDLSSNAKLTKYGAYTNIPKNIPLTVWKMAYQAFLFISPSMDKAVLACRLTDQIEIFDLKNRKSKVINGPENYKPEYTVIKSGGVDLITRNEKSRFAFVNGATTKKYIYLLYSGNIHTSEFIDNGKIIYVFDWEGNPIKSLNLDSYISSFTVTEDDSVLYAYNPDTKFIVKTKLKSK